MVGFIAGFVANVCPKQDPHHHKWLIGNYITVVLTKYKSPSPILNKISKLRWLTNEHIGLHNYNTKQISHQGKRVGTMDIVIANTPEAYHIATAFFTATCANNIQAIKYKIVGTQSVKFLPELNTASQQTTHN